LNLPWLDAHNHRDSLPTDDFFGLSCSPGPKAPLCLGIHPWDIQGSGELQLQNLEEAICSKTPLCVGEAGLDRIKGAPLETQERVFEKQLDLANRFRLPVVIHMVRSQDRIQYFHKKMAKTHWMIHDFQGSEEAALALIGKGIFLSFSPRILKDQSKVRTYLSALPLDFIFFETDEFAYQISSLYGEISSVLGCEAEELNEICWKNLERFLEVDRESILA